MSNYLNTVKESRFSASARSVLEALTVIRNTQPQTVNELMQLWLSRFKQRRSLANMPDHLLKDIGVSRRDALEEACKPFWQK